MGSHGRASREGHSQSDLDNDDATCKVDRTEESKGRETKEETNGLTRGAGLLALVSLRDGEHSCRPTAQPEQDSSSHSRGWGCWSNTRSLP